uniref:Lectin-Abr-1 n=1 Tax=Abronia graminea TaxID=278977 RepID=K4I4J7_ABRGR
MGLFAYFSFGFLISGLFLRGADADSCPVGWFPFETFCYKIFTTRMSWPDAELACQNFNSHLASIHSKEEGDQVAGYVGDHLKLFGHVWIGMRDMWKNGVWSWTDNSPSNYTAWNIGEPNNQRSQESCVELWSFSGYRRWNDKSCKSERAFLCKYGLQ